MPSYVILAEVLDKEPVLGAVWLGYLTLAAAGYLACRRISALLYVMLPLSAAFCLPLILELYDPEVGRAIRQESFGYFLQANLAILLAMAGPYLGALAHEKHVERPSG